MLLVCPSCASSYEVPDAKIGSAGRTVRCKRCATTWFASLPDAFDQAVAPLRALADEGFSLTPEKGATATPDRPAPDAEPPAPAAAAEPGELTVLAVVPPETAPAAIDGEVIAVSSRAADETAGEPAVEIDAEPQKPAPPSSLMGRMFAFLRRAGPPPRRVASKTSAARPGARKGKRAGKPAAASGRALPLSVFLVASLAVAVVALRDPIANASPIMAKAFGAVGLNAGAGPAAILAVRSEIGRSDGVEVLLVEGELVNNARAPAPAPALRAIIRDEAGAELYEWPAQTLKTTLEPGEKTLFRARLAAPPARGHSVIVRIARDAGETHKPGPS